MKIYFVASITGKKYYLDNYKKIIKELENLGHTVISDHIIGAETEQLLNESSNERSAHYKKVKKWLSSVDIVIAEVSYPSVSVGYELAHALEKGKPVLALHVPEKVPVALLGEPSDKLTMESYLKEELKKDLNILVKLTADQMDVRFNFFVSPKIVNYLDWIAKKKKMPRAVYLRRLIEKEMEKNKEFLEGK
jgi:2'-deoxynucleoside 5'-phosphate N-hydrolase